MNSSALAINDRVKIGKKYEQEAKEVLNQCELLFDGHRLVTWLDASQASDMHQKVDFLVGCDHCDTNFTAQFKHRETGTDIICAAYMPYPGDVRFRSAVKQAEDDQYFDRDLKYKGYFYVCSNEDGLFITKRETVHDLVTQAVDEMVLCARKMEQWKWFTAESGVQLHLKQDKGAGYSEGQWKLIAYVPRDSVKAYGEYVEVPND